jgi:hypothetical protein
LQSGLDPYGIRKKSKIISRSSEFLIKRYFISYENIGCNFNGSRRYS